MKPEIRRLRIAHVQNIQSYREEGRPIIYMDKTYLRSTTTNSRPWTDSVETGLKTDETKYAKI
jgi:hypothetical protein